MVEGAIVAAVLIAVTALPGGMFWRNNTGSIQAGPNRFIRFGLVGSGDILGCYRGRAVAIECKTATGRQSPSQVNFQRAWEAAGGLYILARSVEDALEALDR